VKIFSFKNIISVLVYSFVIFKMSQMEGDVIDDEEEISWCERNIIKIIVVIGLVIVAIGCAIVLAVVLVQQAQREKALLEKKHTWSTRLEECAPILKVAAPIIGNIIKVAFSVLLI
jgi:flagellar basal body-associated protein FliL